MTPIKQLQTPKGFARMLYLRATTTNLTFEEIIKDIRKVCLDRYGLLYLDESRELIKDRYELSKNIFDSIEKEI